MKVTVDVDDEMIRATVLAAVSREFSGSHDSAMRLIQAAARGAVTGLDYSAMAREEATKAAREIVADAVRRKLRKLSREVVRELADGGELFKP